jgi:hypothetical protein
MIRELLGAVAAGRRGYACQGGKVSETVIQTAAKSFLAAELSPGRQWSRLGAREIP